MDPKTIVLIWIACALVSILVLRAADRYSVRPAPSVIYFFAVVLAPLTAVIVLICLFFSVLDKIDRWWERRS